MCVCTSHIVLVLMSALRKLLEFRNNKVITAGTLSERSHAVMNLLASVDTKDHIVHLFVGELHNLVI